VGRVKAISQLRKQALFSAALKELTDERPSRAEPEVQPGEDRLDEPLGSGGINKPVTGCSRRGIAQHQVKGAALGHTSGDTVIGEITAVHHHGSGSRPGRDGVFRQVHSDYQTGCAGSPGAIVRPGPRCRTEIENPLTRVYDRVLPVDRLEFVDASRRKPLVSGAPGKMILSSSSFFSHTCYSSNLTGDTKGNTVLPVNRQSLLRRPLPYRAYNITFILIGINLAVFFLSMLSSQLTTYIAMNPVLTIGRGFWWQPFTYMFAHSGISHVVFNMLGLFFFGTQVEREMGSYEFLLFYLLTGTLAGFFSLAVYWFSGSYYVFLLGASGAVFAVLLAFATYYPNAQIFIFGILPMRASVLVLLYTAIEVFSQMRGGSNVAHLTHLAGFGFAYVYFVVRVGLNPIRRFFP